MAAQARKKSKIINSAIRCFIHKILVLKVSKYKSIFFAKPAPKGLFKTQVIIYV